MKPKILANRTLFQEALDFLSNHVDYELTAAEGTASKDSFITAIQNKQGLLPLLTDTIDKDIIDAAPSLKIIANCAVGYNNIDIEHARKNLYPDRCRVELRLLKCILSLPEGF